MQLSMLSRQNSQKKNKSEKIPKIKIPNNNLKKICVAVLSSKKKHNRDNNKKII